ncbi:LysE family translocator [Deinococcus roseus]|uniref:Lysine transporter LysE n=1 Tax=Deinococcus roseus TaxID=392414 RepID=A0ABQ2D353_9DEIO|nr:LysE family translocator [Deinococcus roseus]GGJ40269.1 lysine transporter LysE [Deinococcus roseus]
MLPSASLIAFALIALGMVLTPGPNMMYLVSRSICQGRKAGMYSLAGVVLGFVVYLLLAAFGLTAVVMAVPFAYDTLRFAGALYLGYLAWNTLKPGGRSPFQVKDLPEDAPGKLFLMGLLTNLLNPKIAVLYLSLLPQFIDVNRGHVLEQGLILGCTQILVSLTVNTTIVLLASSIAAFLGKHPRWATFQRYLMGTVLGALAVRMALETRKA